jgi:RHS repeat-associated protein
LDLSGSFQGAGGIGGLLAMTTGNGASCFYHQDGGGNVTALMDAAQNIVQRRMYDGFGRTTRLTGIQTGNPFWFSGQLHDEDTDYCFYKYRIYVPSLNRWLNQDPIGEKGFSKLNQISPNDSVLLRSVDIIQAMLSGVLMPPDLDAHSSGENLFCFVRNNAVNHFDFLGLEDCPCTKAPPLPSNSPVCDSYGNEKYPGTGLSLKCFCKCAGNSSWSQQVRGCLACEHSKGTDPLQAHIECYKAAGLGKAPWLTLTKCFVQCGGVPVMIATQ